MSSFINSPKHFSTIKNNLKKVLFYSAEPVYLPYSMADKYQKIYNKSYFVEEREKELDSLINTFAELQAICVNLQYKHHSENLDLDIKISVEEVKKEIDSERVSNIKLLKLINCAFYQVETEHLTELRQLTKEEKRAFNFVKEIQKALTEHIIYNSEDYKSGDCSI